MKTGKKYLLMAGLFAALAISVACRKPTAKLIRENLMGSMEHYLNNPAKTSTGVHFKVLDVIYYDEKTHYDCEFKVRMQTPKQDTTGKMNARVSHDFKDIQRKS